MEKLLDFNAPLDIALLDRAADAFSSGSGGAEAAATQSALVAFQNHPMAWTRVDAILEQSTSAQSRWLALNILEQTVKHKWLVLPAVQRDGIKTYTVSLIIKMSGTHQSLKQNSAFMTKLNTVLVQIVKQEWPHNWPTFIPELVNSSRTSQSLCTNNMAILKLLSEEIFDFGQASMTSDKVQQMKLSLNNEFTLIFQLCDFVLNNSSDSLLLAVTIQTLQRFLHWIPAGYIFETNLIQLLCEKFFRSALFQNDALQCLSEIAPLQLEAPQTYDDKFQYLFVTVMQQVSNLIKDDTPLHTIYETGDEAVQIFVRHLTLFITGFLKAHLSLVETSDPQCTQALDSALRTLVKLSTIDDTTIFKCCLDYWIVFVEQLYTAERLHAQRHKPLSMLSLSGTAPADTMSPRTRRYLPLLSSLRRVMIASMAKPEEVLIVEDENGQIVREQLKDTDSITLYKSMRECLVYLVHLDPDDAQELMLSKLTRQVDGSEWSWRNLNTLCWAIGSVSGTLPDDKEKPFLVRVIKDLLQLCELQRGKDNKAVIASNIMYVVGQYPRFLKQHWKFLKTVVNKLFEFMHETHPGVQDMSVDTLYKISLQCSRKFVRTQLNETRPFICEILEQMPQRNSMIRDLEASQLYVFYETLGEIIKSETDEQQRQQLTFQLMSIPNERWTALISRASSRPDVLFDTAVVKELISILRTNTRVAASLGHGFIVQLGKIYVEMLQIYKLYSKRVSDRIAADGVKVTGTAEVRAMRAVKKESLNLIRTVILSATDADSAIIHQQYLPALLDPVLDDYARCGADAREVEVLSLFTAIISKLGSRVVPAIPHIFDSIYKCTLHMLTANFTDYPDHRLAAFRLLQAIVEHGFAALITFSPDQFQLCIQSICWAMKHIDRAPSDIGLETLLSLLQAIEATPLANDFYKQYYLQLLSDVLALLTDTFHKSGFRLQTSILARLIGAVDSGAVTIPLSSSPANPMPDRQFANNPQFCRAFISRLLTLAFDHLSPDRVDAFVMVLLQQHTQLTVFKNACRDFLTSINDYSAAQGNEELYADERTQQQQQEAKAEQDRVAAVPGLAYQAPQQKAQQQQQQQDGDM